MPITRARTPLNHRLMAAGSVLCVAALVAWATAASSGKAAPALPAVLQPAAVLVSVGTLDMSRLGPAHFGDWDVAAQAGR